MAYAVTAGRDTRVSVGVTDDGLGVVVSCVVADANLELLKDLILQEIASLGIAHAPDADSLARWLREQEAHGARIEGMVLLKGEAAIAPQDGSIEWGGDFFDTGFLMDETTGAIDYRRHAAQVAVKQGQFLARFIPPRPGTEGHDVFGKRIVVQKPKAPRIRAGANVRADESSNEFYATKDGRVRFSDGVLLVDPVYRVTGSVDLAVGDIVHYGAVLVEHDVVQGARIEASGDIEIMGFAEPANIVCGGTLFVHGAIMGGEGHTIRVKGGVRARLIAGADIEAGGDIEVEREIVNSHVKTGGKVQMPHGRLVGGTLTAHGGVSVGQLGSPGAIRTDLVVGEDYQLKAEIEVRDKRASELAEMFAAYSEKAQLIRQHMERLSTEQQEKAMLLFLKVDELQDSLKELHDEIEEVRAASRARAKRTVDVSCVVYPETMIGMRGERLHVNEEIPGPIRFRLLDGTILGFRL